MVKESPEQRLNKLKRKFSNARNELARKQGELDHVLKTLDIKFGIKSKKDAKQKLEELQDKKERLTKRIVNKLEEAEKIYEFETEPTNI